MRIGALHFRNVQAEVTGLTLGSPASAAEDWNMEIGGIDPAAQIQYQVKMAATAKMLDVQKQMGADLVALLDPNKGTLLNVSA